MTDVKIAGLTVDVEIPALDQIAEDVAATRELLEHLLDDEDSAAIAFRLGPVSEQKEEV